MYKEREDISRLTIQRMALYYSALKLMKADGITICISKDLGRLAGISPFNVRKDLAYFGEFGTKGVGYQTSYLLGRIEEILGYDTRWNAVLVGVGLQSLPIMYDSCFWPPAVKLVAVIDLDKRNRGLVTPESKVKIESMENIKGIIRSKKITIAVITVPPAKAQNIADQLILAGIKGIVSMVSLPICVPKHITITQVNLASWFGQLTYAIKHCQQKEIAELS